jgi:hypothetical protein
VEQVWQPVSGYHFEKAADGRYRIIETNAGTDWGKVFWAAVGAILSHQFTAERPDEGAIAREVVRPAARQARDALGSAAIQEIVDPEPGECHGVTLDPSWSLR